MRINYTITPLVQTISSIQRSEFTAERNRLDFWEFLSAPFLKQLDAISFRWLRRRGIIKHRNWTEETVVGFESFDTGSIATTIAEYVCEYIRTFGQDPGMILIGRDTHKLMMSSPEIDYFMDDRDFYRSSLRSSRGSTFQGIRVVLVPHMAGFVLLSSELARKVSTIH